MTIKLMIIVTSRGPVEGKSSACLICMKYRIIIVIIIIISLGQISLSYIENTSRTHAHIHRRGFQVSSVRWRPNVTTRPDGDNGRRCVIQTNTREGDPVSLGFCVPFAYKKLPGRTETRTCDRMCFQTIRTV